MHDRPRKSRPSPQDQRVIERELSEALHSGANLVRCFNYRGRLSEDGTGRKLCLYYVDIDILLHDSDPQKISQLPFSNKQIAMLIEDEQQASRSVRFCCSRGQQESQ
jgi:hypothetical protein